MATIKQKQYLIDCLQAPTRDEWLDHDSDYWKQQRKQINDLMDYFLRTGKLPETNDYWKQLNKQARDGND